MSKARLLNGTIQELSLSEYLDYMEKLSTSEIIQLIHMNKNLKNKHRCKTFNTEAFVGQNTEETYITLKIDHRENYDYEEIEQREIQKDYEQAEIWKAILKRS